LFCGDATDFGAAPNTQISPITMGHPGTLPKTNEKAIEFAITMGLACGCAIEKNNYFARKNYFYPDLPKGYQITQHTTPICVGGAITIKSKEGDKIIQLNRIHFGSWLFNEREILICNFRIHRLHHLRLT
jgi:aspartyl-tRNA(Asn)/glutamyl-tRNA(Gln) amidotransferase subunit B